MLDDISSSSRPVNVRHLRCVVAAAEELHFTRAAQRLGISKSAFSTLIKEAEREIGAVLFDRNSRNVRVTPAGAELYRRSAVALEQLDRSTIGLDRVAAGESGTLRIAFDASSALSILPQALDRLRSMVPGLNFTMHVASGGDALDRVVDGSVDVAIVRGRPNGPEVVARLVLTEPLVACVPAEKVDAPERASVTLVDLARYPLVAMSRGHAPGHFEEVMAAFGAHPPRIGARTRSHEETLAMVAVGEGVALVPACVAAGATARVRTLTIRRRPTTSLFLATWGRPAGAGALLETALQWSASDGTGHPLRLEPTSS